VPRVLLISGHSIDAPGRATPRFPPSAEATVRDAIRGAIVQALGSTLDGTMAMSAGASGSDLLFLEICEELGIPRQLLLIMPRDEYVRTSVAPAGVAWVRRFNHQFESVAVRTYQQGVTLPVWLQDKPNYSVWERSNAWVLHNALWRGGVNTTLIALWDGEQGDGPGGTKHMIELARARGAQTIVLDTKALFALPDKTAQPPPS
jgi:hypothetical protein